MLGYCHQSEVENNARNETCYSINQVMRLDINGGQTQENVKWQHRINQFVLARMPAQQHDDGTYTYMRTREGCRRTFASSLGIFYELIEYTISIAWCWQTVAVAVEVIAHCREDSLRDVSDSHGIKIERRSYYRYEDVDDIIDEEASQHHKRCTLSLIVSAEK